MTAPSDPRLGQCSCGSTVALDEIEGRDGLYRLSCPDCGLTFAVRIESMDPAVRWRSTLAGCAVPERYLMVPEALDLRSLAEWRGDPWAVTFLGPTGTGKTWIAVRLLGSACRALGRLGRFVDTLSAIVIARDEIGERPARWVSIRERMIETPVLLLDDLGAQRLDTEFGRELIGHVLRERYNRTAATIVTSNAKTPEELADVAGEAVASRLSSGRIVALRGFDRRVGRPA